jgi:hypothetical protein
MARISLLALVTLLGAAVSAAGEEAVGAHADASRKVITLVAERIVPADITMKAGDVLQFENLAFHPLAVRFIEPEDQAKKIRCEYVGAKDKAPWLLFEWDDRGRLTGVLPPGRVASICSLAPGQYTYLVQRAGGEQAATIAGSRSDQKGTITVQ